MEMTEQYITNSSKIQIKTCIHDDLNHKQDNRNTSNIVDRNVTKGANLQALFHPADEVQGSLRRVVSRHISLDEDTVHHPLVHHLQVQRQPHPSPTARLRKLSMPAGCPIRCIA
jgi:hypothetical protein